MANEKLIERSFAKRHFETLARRYQGSFTGEAFERAAQEVAEMPGVDAVEVVWCKDCKHWHEETGWCCQHSHFIDSKGGACHPWESNDWKMFDADYYCADGERKSDG